MQTSGYEKKIHPGKNVKNNKINTLFIFPMYKFTCNVFFSFVISVFQKTVKNKKTTMLVLTHSYMLYQFLGDLCFDQKRQKNRKLLLAQIIHLILVWDKLLYFVWLMSSDRPSQPIPCLIGRHSRCITSDSVGYPDDKGKVRRPENFYIKVISYVHY